MKKRNGIITLIVMILVTVLCVFTALRGWGPTGPGAMKNIKLGLDLSGGVSITYEADTENPSVNDMDDTVWKLQQRVQNYSTEANVYKEGTNRINVEIPGVSDANQILQELGTPGSLYFIAQTDADGNQNYALNGSEYVLNKTIEELKENGAIVCEGPDVSSAEGGVTQDSTTKNNEYVVELTFTSEGAKKFADATTKAFNAGESIGIYYDGRFVSVPRVNSAITDGKAIIEGMDSIEEAKELASYIRIGGLKVTLNEIRSNVVGAQLGQEAIRTSLIGGAIGLGLVILIMLVFYLVPGVVASFALILYVALMLILLNAFDLTLTLPGIAGIILGIGMAVDANVIIYSRLQEELMVGTSVRGAIQAGFHKAMSAILDGNITTLIAAAVLGVLGTGTIKGFAMTLALSVVLSMFTALVISRFLIRAVYAAGIQDEKLWARPKKLTHFRFVKNWVRYLIVAAVIMVIGIGSMIMHGGRGEHALNFSLEFLGGTSTTVGFNEDLSLADLDEKVTPILQDVIGEGGAGVSYQKVVGSNDVIIKTRTLTVDERAAMAEQLEEKFGVEEAKITAESISPTVGSEMRRSAILAVVIAVILMLLYIFIRFKDIRFATSAVLALIHDVLITLMCYAILRISVGGSFIAVMLTILGYSINSTIVIFDRIRENMTVMTKNDTFETLVDNSINMTLTRSILTNLTTFASILMLYVLGVASIKEFTLPMMVGILAGACSSVFLTGALWHYMRTHFGVDAKEYQKRAAKMEQKAAPSPAKEGGQNASGAGGSFEVKKSGNPNVIRKKKVKKAKK
ncbi:MAG: protein translocase subunit SecD [Lachnospiraceae bacterium]|nr:protein translocase subunit SecD [Lachnospiraceae bacterium]